MSTCRTTSLCIPLQTFSGLTTWVSRPQTVGGPYICTMGGPSKVLGYETPKDTSGAVPPYYLIIEMKVGRGERPFTSYLGLRGSKISTEQDRLLVGGVSSGNSQRNNPVLVDTTIVGPLGFPKFSVHSPWSQFLIYNLVFDEDGGSFRVP